MAAIYCVTALLFLAFSIFVTLIDKNDGTPLRRIPGLTSLAGMLAMTFLYASLFILDGRHDLLLRVIISGGILYVLAFYCVSVCLRHHWATSLQVVILVSMAWLSILAEQLINDSNYSTFAYVFHVLLVCMAINKLFSCAHGSGKDAMLSKVLLVIAIFTYELVWAFVITSNLLNDDNVRLSAFAAIDLLLFPIIFVQHLYLPLRAYQ